MTYPRTIDEAIDIAARDLPALYEITITIERHGYAVKICDPDCNEISCDGGDGIISDILHGIEIAKQQGGAE